MLTSTVNLTATAGDSWVREIPLLLAETGLPAPPDVIAAYAARFTVLKMVIAPKQPVPVVLTSAAGELGWGTSGIRIEGPALKMGLPKGLWNYGLTLTEPRPGHPLGNLVWTLCRGKIEMAGDPTP